MQNILAGIWGHYDDDATLKAAITGLYFEAAPQDAALPYGIYTLVTGAPEYFFGDLVYELIEIQFDLYASTNSDLQTAYDALTALYDDAAPSMSGYTPIIMERNFYSMMKDGNQDQYFRAIVTYDCRFEKGDTSENILLNGEYMLISSDQAVM